MRKSARFLAAGLVLASLLMVAGCFDYDVTLKLNQEGHGSLSTALSLPAHLAGAESGRKLGTIVLPLPEVESERKNGRLVISESAHFTWLHQLSARRVRFIVKEIDHGPLDITSPTFRITAELASAEGDLPDRDIRPGTERELRRPPVRKLDPAEARARRYLAGTWAGHYLGMTLELPGQVTRAYPLEFGAEVVTPRVGKQRRVVRWRVPLGLLAAENVRHTLVFRAEFKARLQFRGPLQREVQSRFATAEDHAAAAELRAKQKSGKGEAAPEEKTQ